MRQTSVPGLSAFLLLVSAAYACQPMPEPTPAAADGSRPCPGSDPMNVVPPAVTLSASDSRARLVTREILPKSPTATSKRGVRSEAMVSFVIDTLGNVDPHSGLVLSSTTWQWAVAICRVLPRMRYEPVRENGRLVRARLMQAYAYHSDP